MVVKKETLDSAQYTSFVQNIATIFGNKKKTKKQNLNSEDARKKSKRTKFQYFSQNN